MSLRFRYRIPIFRGVHLNLGKHSVSLSVGTPGATLNLGQMNWQGLLRRGPRVTVGLPGTGLSYNMPVALPKAAPVISGKRIIDVEALPGGELSVEQPAIAASVADLGSKQSSDSSGILTRLGQEKHEEAVRKGRTRFNVWMCIWAGFLLIGLVAVLSGPKSQGTTPGASTAANTISAKPQALPAAPQPQPPTAQVQAPVRQTSERPLTCMSPDDLDSAGRRCGGRAASVRRGRPLSGQR